MNFYEARKKSVIYRCVGLLIILPCVISTVVSFLKMIYFRLDDGSTFGSALAEPFKNFVSFIYQKTEFLMFFWQKSPTPNHINLSEPDNIPFVFIYLAIFVGITFWGLGRELSYRLNKIRKKIEDQVIEESIRGNLARSQSEITNAVHISSDGILASIHSLYIAPVVVTVVGAILVHFLGI
ncbi:YniB family protein [Aeromonas veronii]|uniref:YniB family protein n=1 Tax=Aeromonas veronii TaxID=654 RepID=UPI00330DBE59|nr:hypothetical protein [Aeromonas veronii]